MEDTKQIKAFNKIKDNNENFRKVNNTLYKDAVSLLGDKYQNKYYLPNDFDYNLLNEDFFHKRETQTFAIPLTTNMFKKFICMQKTPVNSYFKFTSNNHLVVGQYFANVENDKTTLFAFSYVQSTTNKKDFSLKLDMCFQGQEWLNLVRLDGYGNMHPNYYTAKKVVDNFEDVEYVDFPHLHYNCLNTQILSNDKLDYSSAVFIEQLKQYENTDKYLEECLTYFSNITGTNQSINIDAFTKNQKNTDYFKNQIYLYNEDTLSK